MNYFKVKKRSATKDGGFKWNPHDNLNEDELVDMLISGGWLGDDDVDAGDRAATLIVVRILLEDDEFIECGDYLIYGISGDTPQRPTGYRWKHMSTAPKDVLIDVWCQCVNSEGCELHIRLTDVFWHEADTTFPHTGWMRCLDDGNWDMVEGEASSEHGLPPWTPTHWTHSPNNYTTEL